MSNLDTLKLFLGISGTSEDSLLNAYLISAESSILNKMYPFGAPEEIRLGGVPDEYRQDLFKIASYLYLKRGAEGEVQHDENGIARVYESADIPKSMLKHIRSYVGVV